MDSALGELFWWCRLQWALLLLQLMQPLGYLEQGTATHTAFQSSDKTQPSYCFGMSPCKRKTNNHQKFKLQQKNEKDGIRSICVAKQDLNFISGVLRISRHFKLIYIQTPFTTALLRGLRRWPKHLNFWNTQNFQALFSTVHFGSKLLGSQRQQKSFPFLSNLPLFQCKS